MSENDFEARLSALCRMLKLTPTQSATISAELRNQIERRVEELARSGKPRSDAIKQANSEFGDASGLAVNLTQVSQMLIRRWVIGSTLVSVSVILLAVATFAMSNWSASRDSRGMPTAGQVAETAAKSTDSLRLLLDPQPDDVSLPQLSKVAAIRFPPDCPLNDALQELARQQHVSIVLDRVAIEEFGLTADEPLNVPVLGLQQQTAGKQASSGWPHQLTLAQTLNVMLEELDLTWYVKGGVIVVTTIDVERDPRRMFSRSYNVVPLLRSGITPDTIAWILTGNTNSMWEELDGNGGNFTYIAGVLVVSQSYQAHREIRSLLLKLVQPGGSPWVEYAPERASLSKLLRTPWSANYPPDMPLQDFLDSISQKTGVPFLLDQDAIEESGLTIDEPLTMQALDSVPLETHIGLALDLLDLTLILRDGLPTVTTVDVANDPTRLPIAVYDVKRILKPNVDPEAIIDAVQSMAGAQWEEIDGTGGRVTLSENGLLVVTQTDFAHRALQRLLAVW
ncbi:hypothetical protein GC176_04350 [bacterium]|nr:hypothetical protein [bacterium]